MRESEREIITTYRVRKLLTRRTREIKRVVTVIFCAARFKPSIERRRMTRILAFIPVAAAYASGNLKQRVAEERVCV